MRNPVSRETKVSRRGRVGVERNDRARQTEERNKQRGEEVRRKEERNLVCIKAWRDDCSLVLEGSQ